MIAVTGITGHTGRYFAKELKDNDFSEKIKCLVRSEAKADEVKMLGPDFMPFIGNLNNENDIRQFLTDVDTVVHIANIHYSPEIVRIGRECGIRRFILIHTTGIYSEYKSAAEEYRKIESMILPLAEEYNITILRPSMIFGDMNDRNISHFIRWIDKYKFMPIIGKGKSRIQPVNARDLGKVYYKALVTPQSAGKCYDVTGKEPVTMREMYDLISEALGKRRHIISVPLKPGVLCARALRFLTGGKVDFVEKVQRMGEDRAYEHSAAEKDLGYCPEDFRTGLIREINQYLDKKKIN